MLSHCLACLFQLTQCGIANYWRVHLTVPMSCCKLQVFFSSGEASWKGRRCFCPLITLTSSSLLPSTRERPHNGSVVSSTTSIVLRLAAGHGLWLYPRYWSVMGCVEAWRNSCDSMNITVRWWSVWFKAQMHCVLAVNHIWQAERTACCYGSAFQFVEVLVWLHTEVKSKTISDWPAFDVNLPLDMRQRQDSHQKPWAVWLMSPLDPRAEDIKASQEDDCQPFLKQHTGVISNHPNSVTCNYLDSYCSSLFEQILRLARRWLFAFPLA